MNIFLYHYKGINYLLTGIFLLFILSIGPVAAVPSGISFSRMTPVEGTTLQVARTSADSPLDSSTFQLKGDIYINNTSTTDASVTNVRFSYPGTAIPDRTYLPIRFPDDDPATLFIISARRQGRVPVYDGLGRDLPTPLPESVQIEVFLSFDPDPLVLNFDLAFRDNPVPLGANFFPAKTSDLDTGEYWGWRTRHTVDAGGGGGTLNPSTRSQRYGLDMDVRSWDGSRWRGLAPGTDGSSNDHFLVFGKPLYAINDGTIISCYRGEPDHDPGDFDDITFETGGGNNFIIQHGSDRVLYAHMQEASNDHLCPGDGQNDNLNIPVKAGDFLGLVGNTGRSTGPHLHIHAQHDPGSGQDTIEGVPLQFMNVRALGDDDSINNLGETPSLQPLHGKTLHRNSLIEPNPCGFELPESGYAEVSYHGIVAECYQDVFNMTVARNYRPVFVDGYAIGSENYFNATFRPAGPASVARHGLTGAEYQDLFDEMTANGFRLHQVDSYLDGGNVRYAAIFEQRLGPAFAAFHGLSDAAYSTRFTELANDGFVAINISTVEVAGQLRWTGLFERVDVNGWTAETVSAANYQSTFDSNVDAGRIPIYVQGFSTAGGPLITGIWVDPVGGGWAAVHGLSSAGYQTQFDSNLAAGRLTRAVSGYDNGGGNGVFAAVWRSRPNTMITESPSNVTNQTTANFSFEANIPFATFECRLDGGSFSSCVSPEMLTVLSEGSHTFWVRAVDRETVRDLTPASYSWLVDVTPPSIEILAPQEDTKTVHGVLKDELVEETTVVGWADFSASIVDSGSGVDSVVFEVNGVPVHSGDITQSGSTWGFLFEPDLQGENMYVIEVIATDVAGNVSTSSIQVIGTATGKKP